MSEESLRKSKLNLARRSNSGKNATSSANPVKKIGTGQALSFGKKISEHWPILVAAIFFDVFGLIPFLGVLSNMAFGFVLFLYFGPKRKTGKGSEFENIFMPIALGSVFDSIFSFLPVNIGAALFRIYRS